MFCKPFLFHPPAPPREKGPVAIGMAHFSFETGGSAQAPGTAQQPRQPLQFMSFDTQSSQYAGQSFAPPPPNAHVPYDANAYANVPVGGGMGRVVDGEC